MKDFDSWNKEKKSLENIGHDILSFHEREIWWCSIGINLGDEQDGKNELFERPVLILKKYSKDMCFVLPLTTQIKNPKPWYQVIVKIEEEINAVNISQGRVISSKRLLRKIIVLDTADYNAVINSFIKSFNN